MLRKGYGVGELNKQISIYEASVSKLHGKYLDVKTAKNYLGTLSQAAARINVGVFYPGDPDNLVVPEKERTKLLKRITSLSANILRTVNLPQIDEDSVLAIETGYKEISKLCQETREGKPGKGLVGRVSAGAAIISILSGVSILAGLYFIAGGIFSSAPANVYASPGASIWDAVFNGILFLILGLTLGYVGIKGRKKK